MKAKIYQIDALIPQIKDVFFGTLIYGPDIGGIQETEAKITSLITQTGADALSTINITSAAIKDTPGIITDEANTLSFMGGRRLLVARDAGNTYTDSVENFIENRKSNAFLLMTADNLPKNSSLRTLCENSPHILCVACYAQDEREIQAFITTTLTQAGYTADSEALRMLCDRLNDNRMIIRGELDKLFTYMADDRCITATAVDAIITDGSNATIDALCIAVAGGQQARTDKICHILLSQGETPVGLLRFVLGYFNTLSLAVDLISKGLSFDAVSPKVLRPAQFRLQPALRQQTLIWKKQDLIRVHALILTAEKQTKTTGIPPEVILKRTLMSIATVAQKRMRPGGR